MTSQIAIFINLLYQWVDNLCAIISVGGKFIPGIYHIRPYFLYKFFFKINFSKIWSVDGKKIKIKSGKK
jgi:hypothetical protein